MKKHFLFVFLILMAPGILKAQKTNTSKDTAQDNQDIIKLAEQITNIGSTGTNEDQLNGWNTQLEDKIFKYVLKDADFLQHDFPLWTKNGIEVITSADKKLRIVFWNAQTGGTLRDYNTLIFWKGTKKVEGKVVSDADNSSFSSLNLFRKQDGSIFYLAQGMAHASNRDKIDFIRGYKINGNAINEQYKAFKTPKKSLHEISSELDMGSVTTANNMIHYSNDKKTLYIPVVNAQGEVKPDYYLIYKFDGNNFNFRKTAFSK